MIADIEAGRPAGEPQSIIPDIQVCNGRDTLDRPDYGLPIGADGAPR